MRQETRDQRTATHRDKLGPISIRSVALARLTPPIVRSIDTALPVRDLFGTANLDVD